MNRLRTLKTVLGLVVAAATQLIAPQASAAVIDFESGGDWTEVDASGVVLHGYRLTRGAAGFAFIVASNQSSDTFSGNGSNRLIGFNDVSFTLSAQDESAFNLLSFDGGESWIDPVHHWATKIMAVGVLAGGGTTTQVFDLDLIKDPLGGMQTFTLDASFRNLLSVSFSGIGGNPEFSLDNISVSAVPAEGEVPEPAPVALLFLGAAGIAASRRKYSR